MALSIIDVTGLTNSIIVLTSLCLLSLLLVMILSYRLSQFSKVIFALTERMAMIENRYIKIKSQIDCINNDDNDSKINKT